MESLNINEYKALDIEERINTQIDLIRQECADMCAQNQDESKLESMHKKDLENMQDHSERIIKNYETEIKNVRDKLCKFREQRQKQSETNTMENLKF